MLYIYIYCITIYIYIHTRMITYVYLYVLYLCIYTFNYRYTVHVQCDFQPIWDDLEIIFMLGTLHQPGKPLSKNLRSRLGC